MWGVFKKQDRVPTTVDRRLILTLNLFFRRIHFNFKFLFCGKDQSHWFTTELYHVGVHRTIPSNTIGVHRNSRIS